MACTAKLLETFGADLGGGYDIGCKFQETLNSSPLGLLVWQLNHSSLVGAFHRHAHNRICQLSNLATYRKGLGSSALENCESYFSKSNELAASIRHASAFHRWQMISTYMKHNDMFETYGSHSNSRPCALTACILTLISSKSSLQSLQKCTRGPLQWTSLTRKGNA